MSLLARAIGPTKATRLSVSEDGRYAVGPTSDAISAFLSWASNSLGTEGPYALNMVTIYQCVRVLSNTFAQIPLMLYRRRADGGKDRAETDSLYRTLHLQPNPGLSSFAWRRLMMVHLLTWGNFYAEKVFNAFGDLSLFVIRPDRITVGRYPDGTKRYDYHPPDGTEPKEMTPGSIFHVTALSTDGLIGRSIVADLRGSIKLAVHAERFGTNFFANGARPATVLKHPATLSDPAVKRLAGQMEDLRGSGNAGKTVVLEEGLDFAEIGIPPEDAQFLETRVFQKRELAGAFGVQLHKIGDLERATFSNIEHLALEHITDTMMPWFVNVEQELSIQVIDQDELFAEFLVDGYLRGDAKSRNEAYAIRWQHGALSPNEWRIKESDNPIEGGNTYFVPVNYQTLDTALNPPEPKVIAPPVAPDGDGPALRAIKSIRCPQCDRLLAESATAPYRIVCSRCKSVAEAVA